MTGGSGNHAPSIEHEWYHSLLGRLVEAFTAERNIPIRTTCATTLKVQLAERSLEPDESYYIANESAIRGCLDLDLHRDPPPDLAIEVEISRSAMDKLAIYSDLGVREVWFYDGESLRIYMLQTDATYKASPRRVPSCPNLRPGFWRVFLPGGMRATKRPGFAPFKSGRGLPG